MLFGLVWFVFLSMTVFKGVAIVILFVLVLEDARGWLKHISFDIRLIRSIVYISIRKVKGFEAFTRNESI